VAGMVSERHGYGLNADQALLRSASLTWNIFPPPYVHPFQSMEFLFFQSAETSLCSAGCRIRIYIITEQLAATA
jgi:hypothetical protein